VANQYELGQGALANQRYATNQSTAASQAQLAAQQQYQQAQVQLQQQQLASQQAAQLAGLMHGPGTPAALPAAPPPTAAPRSFNSWSSSPVPTSAAPAQSAALNPLMGFGGAYQSYANQMSRGF
jgi:multidrug efflux pump subunit AcrA (membrane-fusion protein)